MQKSRLEDNFATVAKLHVEPGVLWQRGVSRGPPPGWPPWRPLHRQMHARWTTTVVEKKTKHETATVVPTKKTSHFNVRAQQTHALVALIIRLRNVRRSAAPPRIISFVEFVSASGRVRTVESFLVFEYSRRKFPRCNQNLPRKLGCHKSESINH